MSTIINQTDITPCLLLQESLNRYFPTIQRNAPNAGTLQALLSDANRVGTSVAVDVNSNRLAPVTEGKRVVQVRYIEPECEAEDLAEITECSLGSADGNGYKFADVIIDDLVNFGFDLTDDQFKELCENRNTIYLDNLVTKANAALARLSGKLAAKIQLAMGEYNGDSTVTTPINMNFLNPNGTPNIGAFNRLRRHFAEMGYTTQPILVGDTSMFELSLIQPFLGTNTMAGLNLAALDMSRIFFDGQLNTSIANGVDNLLAFTPGTFQYIPFVENSKRSVSEPMTEIVNGVTTLSVKKELSTLRYGGIDWDTFFLYDCGTYKFRFQAKFGLFSLPSDSVCKYPALGYEVGCGDLECESPVSES